VPGRLPIMLIPLYFGALLLNWLLLTGVPLRAMAVDMPNLPDVGEAVLGSLVPSGGTGVQITSHRGEWSVLANLEGVAEPIFLIAGQLKNTTDKPLTYIKFQFELLDDHGVVIVRDYGYNRKAEALREEAYEAGKMTLAAMKIEPIGAGAEDSFRFLFFKSDTPKFRSYRIRITESR
jgi:hypothetical protein